MKMRILVLLVLLGVVLVTASVGTLSGFHTSSAFSTSITVDTKTIKEKTPKVQSAPEQITGALDETAAQAEENDTQVSEPEQVTGEDMQVSEPAQMSE
jgi:hypothetical protein